MKKVKILYTIPNFDTAGSGRVVYDLVKGLDRNAFEVEIACSSDKGAFFKEVEKLGIPIHIITTTTKYRPYLSLYTRLKPMIRFFKENKYNLIHSWHWSSDWTEVLAARLSGVKWMYTKKAMSWGNRHWKIRSYLANFIITINEEMWDYFPKKKNQKLIPLGIDTEYYSPTHFVTTKEHEQAFRIITVANLVPVKGIEVLIKAVHHLQNSSISLDIVGDYTGDYGQTLKAFTSQLGLDQQVHFLGRQSDVRPFIAASHLFVIPTLNEGRKEGMPMALVEAMSMGIPVLGSDISGINYVLKEFPKLLFPAGDVNELGNRILIFKQQSNEEITTAGDTMRRYVVQNFNIDNFISAHEKLYLDLTK